GGAPVSLSRPKAAPRLCNTLSGGERRRAALACVLTAVAPPQLLLLDEPTNHLDLASLANLEQALRLYTGALLVVSHDRTFLENIGVTRTVELPPPAPPDLAAGAVKGVPGAPARSQNIFPMFPGEPPFWSGR